MRKIEIGKRISATNSAPAVYRPSEQIPQRSPRAVSHGPDGRPVVQRFAHTTPTRLAAPPVYRPNNALPLSFGNRSPEALQQKTVGRTAAGSAALAIGHPGQSPLGAPPVYRPHPTATLAQQKVDPALRNHRPQAPPVYHPQSALEVVRSKGAAAQIPNTQFLQRPQTGGLQRLAFPMAPPMTIQRKVYQSGRGPNKGKWCTTLDDNQYFDTEKKAKEFESNFQNTRTEKKETDRQAKRKASQDEHKKLLEEHFPDYTPPAAKRARLYKDKDKQYDDVDLIALNPKNVKKYSENAFAKRKADVFKTQAVNLGGSHFVLAPGTDIGLTSANLRPDVETPESLVPLSRQSKAKTYPEIASSLDKTAEGLAKASGRTLKDTRSRMGKDLDRASRGNKPAPQHKYTKDQWEQMQELAGVLRLDKGRVPYATKHIRGTFASGGRSFKQLFVEEKYLGAGKGGVKRLRGVQKTANGNESEGSDIEDVPTSKNKKARLSVSPARPRPHLDSWADVRARSWNAGDTFTVAGEHDSIYFRFMSVHHGGLGIDTTQLFVHMRGG